MKQTKQEIMFFSKKFYTAFICTYGLKNALRISKEITKLLYKEKKRRKNEKIY